MSSSTPNAPRFLLDENVRVELFEMLVSKGVDVTTLPKSTPDSTLAAVSKRERRVLVTNDADFSEYLAEKIFAVVWLRIPQNDVPLLLAQFKKLMVKCTTYAKKLIILNPDGWKAEPLFRRVRFGKVKSAR